MTQAKPHPVEQAAAVLSSGGLVVYPTETVYGVGADATCRDALESLIRLKGREHGKGVSLLVTGMPMAAGLIAGEPPHEALALAAAFWPGPLTIVLPASDAVPAWIAGPSGGVGLRCSADQVAAELVAAFGAPVTSTSANPSGSAPACSVDEARAYFGDRVDSYLDGGIRGGGAVSSVVEFLDGRAILRRRGALGVDTLSSVTPIETAEG